MDYYVLYYFNWSIIKRSTVDRIWIIVLKIIDDIIKIEVN